MRKNIIVNLLVIFLLIFSVQLFGCEKKSILLPFVSELRSEIFEGKSENFSIKAHYGYRETPYLNDGKVSPYSYELTFFLMGNVQNNVSYSLELCPFNEKVDFEVTNNGTLKASYKVKEFSEKSFGVILCYSTESEKITLTSILPENTLTLNEVLLKVEKSQEVLINSYYSDANFNAEIYARVLVKNDRPFYYIAFANGKTLKAFLVDGLTAEVLAIREVI